VMDVCHGSCPMIFIGAGSETPRSRGECCPCHSMRRHPNAGRSSRIGRSRVRFGARLLLRPMPDHPMTVMFPEGEYLKGLAILKR